MSVIGDGVEILKLVNKGANADLYEKLGKFIELANDLQARVEELKETNRALTEKLRLKDGLYRIRDVLFMQGDPYPLCTKCYEVEKKLIHLRLPGDRSYGVPRCPHCNVYYQGADLRERLEGSEIRFVL